MTINDKYKLEPESDKPPRHVSFTVLLDAKHEWASVRRLLKRLLRAYNLKCTRITEDRESGSAD